MQEVNARFGLSARRICRLTGWNRSSLQYQYLPSRDVALRHRLRHWAALKPRWGAPILHDVLKAEGIVINHKRTERIYREEGLSLRRKRRKKLPAVPKSLDVSPDVDGLIRTVRNQRVILDSDLAALYAVPTFRFNEAVKRNAHRFPEDFCFQLSKEEANALTSQIAMSKTGRGGRRTLPWAFTEHGALQAANILNSPRAVAMSVYVIRAFIRLREELAANSTLEKRLAVIEKTLVSHDSALRDVIQKIRPLLLPPPEPPRKRIGFHTGD